MTDTPNAPRRPAQFPPTLRLAEIVTRGPVREVRRPGRRRHRVVAALRRREQPRQAMKPRKVSMARMAAIARELDPQFWDRLSPAERRELLDRFNAELARETEAATAAEFIARSLRPPASPGGRRRRKP